MGRDKTPKTVAAPPPPLEDKKAGRGHKQRGAGTVITSKAPVVTNEGIILKPHERLPLQLLNEYCNKEARARPVIDTVSSAPGSFSIKITLPDSKNSKNNLVFWPQQRFPSIDQAKHYAALLAVFHFQSNYPIERKLPEPYSSTWLQLIQNKKNETNASGSSTSKKNSQSTPDAKSVDLETISSTSFPSTSTSSPFLYVKPTLPDPLKDDWLCDACCSQNYATLLSGVMRTKCFRCQVPKPSKPTYILKDAMVTSKPLTDSSAKKVPDAILDLTQRNNFLSVKEKEDYYSEKKKRFNDKLTIFDALKKSNMPYSINIKKYIFKEFFYYFKKRNNKNVIKLKKYIESYENEKKNEIQLIKTNQFNDLDEEEEATTKIILNSLKRSGFYFQDEFLLFFIIKLLKLLKKMFKNQELFKENLFLNDIFHIYFFFYINKYNLLQNQNIIQEKNSELFLFQFTTLIFSSIKSIENTSIVNCKNFEELDEELEGIDLILNSSDKESSNILFFELKNKIYFKAVEFNGEELRLFKSKSNSLRLTLKFLFFTNEDEENSYPSSFNSLPVILLYSKDVIPQSSIILRRIFSLNYLLNKKKIEEEGTFLILSIYNYLLELIEYEDLEENFKLFNKEGEGENENIDLTKKNYLNFLNLLSSNHKKENSNEYILIIQNELISFTQEFESQLPSPKEIEEDINGNVTLDSPTPSIKSVSFPSKSHPFWSSSSFNPFESLIKPPLIYKDRSALPAFKHRDEFLEEFIKYDCLLLTGETGCGKTTQIPQYILESFSSTKIIICQPRKLAAIGVATRVKKEQELQTKFSDSTVSYAGPSAIGYMVKGSTDLNKNTRMVFCTYGVLLRRIQSDPLLSGLDVIILDEIHERNLDSDFLLALLVNIMNQRKKLFDSQTNFKNKIKKLKLILMSATISSEKFQDYLLKHLKYLDNIPIINIEGLTYPVDIFYRNNFELLVENYNLFENISSKKFVGETTEEIKYFPINNDRIPINYELLLQLLFFLLRKSSSDVNFELNNDEYYEEKLKEMIVKNSKIASNSNNTNKFNYTKENLKDNMLKKLNHNENILIFLPGLKEIHHLILLIKKLYQGLIYDGSKRKLVNNLENLKFHKNYDDKEYDYEDLEDNIEHNENHTLDANIINCDKSNLPIIELLTLHSNSSSAEQSQAIFPIKNNYQKIPNKAYHRIILATNIAEASLTIPDVTVVIDTCKVKEIVPYNSSDSNELSENKTSNDDTNWMTFNSTSLVTNFSSQASMKQRTGRAGRMKPGRCFRLINESRFLKLPSFSLPEIMRLPLENILLDLYLYEYNKDQSGTKDIDEIQNVQNYLPHTNLLLNCVDCPSENSILKSQQLLTSLQAITIIPSSSPSSTFIGELTPIGHLLAKLPYNPTIGKVLVYSSLFNVPYYTSIIVAYITNKSFFNERLNENQLSTFLGPSTILSDISSDFIIIINIVLHFINLKNFKEKKSFCQSFNFSFEKLNQIIDNIYEILNDLIDSDLIESNLLNNIKNDTNIFISPSSVNILNNVLCGGLSPRIAKIVFPPKKFMNVMGSSLEKERESKEIKFFLPKTNIKSDYYQDDKNNEEIDDEEEKVEDKTNSIEKYKTMTSLNFDKKTGKLVDYITKKNQNYQRVFISPTSLLFKKNTFLYSPYLVYSEILGTLSNDENNKLFIKNLIEASPYLLLLFSGKKLFYLEDVNIISVDGWINFSCNPDVAYLLQEIRQEIDRELFSLSCLKNSSNKFEFFELISRLFHLESTSMSK